MEFVVAALAAVVGATGVALWVRYLSRRQVLWRVLLAEGNTRPEKFCASAKDLKADPDVPNVWQ